jgi:hypothetical protein
MKRDEMHRIAVREELKRICEVMAEMLSSYIRIKGKAKPNKRERGQMEAVETFFTSLAQTEEHATDYLQSDVFRKGLKAYSAIQSMGGADMISRNRYKEFLKSYSESHRLWMLEWLN